MTAPGTTGPGSPRPPRLPRLAAEPPFVPPAPVALLGWHGAELRLTILEPDGTTRVLWTATEGDELVGWPAEGVVVHRLPPDGDDVELVIDPATGEVVVTRPPPVTRTSDHPLSSVVTSRPADPAGVLEVRLDDGTLLWRVLAPTRYRVLGGGISPDGTAAAFLDGAGRLLVATADGAAAPRVWAEDVDPLSEFQWRGDPVVGRV